MRNYLFWKQNNSRSRSDRDVQHYCRNTEHCNLKFVLIRTSSNHHVPPADTHGSEEVMSSSKLKGRRLAELFFTRDGPSSSQWTCRCGAKRAQKGTGYTNLCTHIFSDHPDYTELESGGVAADGRSTLLSFWPRKAQNIHGWLELVIMGLFPFSFCENQYAKRYMRPESITVKTYMKYMALLADVVEKKISNLLPNTFALVFDGWSCHDTHYLSIFATYPSSTERGFSQVLLAFSPMGDEEKLDANEHLQFTSFVLSLFGNNWGNVCALIGDNCSTNKAFSRTAGRKFIGCASHRFNLAMQDIL